MDWRSIHRKKKRAQNVHKVPKMSVNSGPSICPVPEPTVTLGNILLYLWQMNPTNQSVKK